MLLDNLPTPLSPRLRDKKKKKKNAKGTTQKPLQKSLRELILDLQTYRKTDFHLIVKAGGKTEAI